MRATSPSRPCAELVAAADGSIAGSGPSQVAGGAGQVANHRGRPGWSTTGCGSRRSAEGCLKSPPATARVAFRPTPSPTRTTPARPRPISSRSSRLTTAPGGHRAPVLRLCDRRILGHRAILHHVALHRGEHGHNLILQPVGDMNPVEGLGRSSVSALNSALFDIQSSHGPCTCHARCTCTPPWVMLQNCSYNSSTSNFFRSVLAEGEVTSPVIGLTMISTNSCHAQPAAWPRRQYFRNRVGVAGPARATLPARHRHPSLKYLKTDFMCGPSSKPGLDGDIRAVLMPGHARHGFHPSTPPMLR